MARESDGNLACEFEDLSTIPVPRTCRAAFGASCEVLEIDQDLPLRLWGMVSIIFVALFLIWMG
jgi:hypothetical protein